MSPHLAAWVRTASLRLYLYTYNIKEVIEEKAEKAAELAAKRAAKVESQTEAEEEELVAEEEEAAESWDPDDNSVIVRIAGKGGSQTLFNLSNLTFEELLSVKAILDLAFNRAVLSVRSRDRKAVEDASRGVYTHPRLYRQLPEFVVRARLQRGYGQGIRVGPVDVLDGKFMPEHFAGRDAQQGSDMAERESDAPVSQDNRAEDD